MNSINADLHCHSVVSDGTLTPEDLAMRAHQNGVQLWSLTDHDVIGGQHRAREAANKLGMKYTSGVEISVSWMGQTIHIVGIGLDPDHSVLVEGLRKTRDGRTARGKEIARQLAAVGIEGAYEGALTYAGNPELLSRTHFARYLVEKNVCRSTDDVFKNYLIEGKPGYIGHVWASLKESVDWIKASGGVAIIAHPGRYRLTDLQKHELYIAFKEAGGLGIEVITGSHTPRQYEEYAKIALQYGFYASRGSDFHDPAESHIDLGKLPHLPLSLQPVWSLL
ncbi:phosphatase [Polynucleobacter sp. SHI8]|uniref:3',5'-nucleoside bisphosphate phosphatase n=1 Tax=unclassified Polynucleobacter TaxID=2640945 RepID=UPI00248FA60E|nr:MULTISPECIES: 3',5'-nucleoside bisphosphate phosphatase [unclassified Polynucleobacter]BDW11545.1 phosphatase [Polynucleobacter sp. SHI2]BDW13992.1 phosphatase [Polynucleobacter sp. SHI8]